jgi:3D (Asp-Asp-Asp) domain-containing protein
MGLAVLARSDPAINETVAIVGGTYTKTGELTFYGAGDNCPPSGDIAYPVLHKEAGGKGTFDDPITIASDKRWLPKGTKVYVDVYKKYFIMEDECEECEEDYNKGKYHIDAWLGPDTIEKGSTNCEIQLSIKSTSFTVNPGSSHEVDTTQFFSCSGGTCTCMQKIEDPCTDSGSECGNECELPSSMTCGAAASMFLLSYSRFDELNKNPLLVFIDHH